MRVLRGLAEAREFVAGRASITSQDVPEELAQEVARRSQAIWGQSFTIHEAVRRVIEDVRKGGDAALKDLTERIDGIRFADLEVPKKALAQAADSIPSQLRTALELAASRVAQFAEASLPKTWHDPNTGLGELIVPLERVGVYAPGGTAAYPSTVIMSAVTARTAGVDEVIVCSPAHDGVNASAVVLAAAHIAGVDRVFRIGGAQAIAAMAFGTESVPKVDKICGPGNIFVALAKQQLFGQVGIDGVFGPTETVVVADDSADPALCAADLLAQAEHDPLASAVLVTPSESLVARVGDELVKQLMTLERRDIALASLNNHGAMILVKDLAQALDVSNLIAPEHLCLMVKQPRRWVKRVRHAGGLFLGEHSAEVMGDYVAGPSHTIPTHGTARFASYLGVDQFIKRIPVIALKKDVAHRLAPTAAIIARAEGFTGHAHAADLRAELEE